MWSAISAVIARRWIRLSLTLSRSYRRSTEFIRIRHCETSGRKAAWSRIARAHPYQTIVPPGIKKVDRWFLLNTSLDPQQPWEMGTVIPVYSLAIVKGNAPQRQWLIYAHSPLGLRKGVRINVPDFGSIQMDVTVDGSFFTIDEQSRTVSKVN
ncbi:MAG: hypothetical protein IPO77_06765 [Acidobacteria bacterium]|nr:hypothetical protein [Acidobacteriota bacterium]